MDKTINVQPTWEQLLPVLADNYKRDGSPHETNPQYKALLEMARLLDQAATMIADRNSAMKRTIRKMEEMTKRLLNHRDEIEELTKRVNEAIKDPKPVKRMYGKDNHNE